MIRHRVVNALRTAALVAVVVLAGSASVVSSAHADAPGLVPTPPMGFNDWNAYGCNVNATLIEDEANYIHSSGMQRDGYKYVNIDDCWLAPQRSATGALAPDPAKFPQGISAVARYVHHLGLKLGIYEDAGTETCAGYPGSFGHEVQDARTFASWGVDYVKYDQCNIPFSDFPGMTHAEVDTQLYTTMSRALKATGRPIVFSMCNGTDSTVYPWLWGARVSNLWRTTTDIRDNFASTVTNFMGTVGLWPYAHAGAFNDPDMLEIGNGGQTLTEYRSQFSLWSEMAAPLIAGTNLTTLSAADRAIYENRRVIAVDQDPLARQGRPIAYQDGTWVLSKPLQGGDHAVALFNSTSTPRVITTTAHAVGASPAPSYRLENLWGGAVTRSGGVISAFVPAEGTVMYRVTSLSAGDPAAARPATVLSLHPSAATITPGGSLAARLTLSDDGRVALHGATVTVTAPAGWSPQTTTLRLPRLAAGRSLSRRLAFTVTPTATGPLTTLRLHAGLRTRWGSSVRLRALGGASAAVTVSSPLTSPLQAENTTGAPARTGQLGSDLAITSAGTGITPLVSSSRGTFPASDAYAAIADPGAVTPTSTASVTVTAQTGSALRPDGTAGLIERDSLSAPGTPEGVSLSVSTGGTVTLAWASKGGTAVDRSVNAPTTVTLPVTLRLQRDGSTYNAAYSTDGGATWTAVATATVAASASSGDQDVGVFHASGVAGWRTTADFTDLTLS